MKKEETGTLAAIVEPLLGWYEGVRRPLPWRIDPTPYHVWISEIMLQQTRIEAVLPYYERFLAACPTVADLAGIDDDALMKLWEGLGYYSRARNLKRAAALIVARGGELPASCEELRALPGIGPYTAGAISSIAFGLPEPAVDGNVLRVVTRLLADEGDVTLETTKTRVGEALRAVYPRTPDGASAFTQALMELGQTVCLPAGAPRCEACPLGLSCRARAGNKTDRIPVRSPKAPRKIVDRTVFLLWNDGRVAVRKRPPRGLLASLYEFPGVDEILSEDAAKAALTAEGHRVLSLLPAGQASHVFTHVEWHMTGYHVLLDAPDDRYLFVTPGELSARIALPSAFRGFASGLSDPFLK